MWFPYPTEAQQATHAKEMPSNNASEWVMEDKCGMHLYVVAHKIESGLMVDVGQTSPLSIPIPAAPLAPAPMEQQNISALRPKRKMPTRKSRYNITLHHGGVCPA